MMLQIQGTKLRAGGNGRFEASALLGMYTWERLLHTEPGVPALHVCLCLPLAPWAALLGLLEGSCGRSFWVCRGRRQLDASLAGLKHTVLLLLCSKAESLSTLLLCEATHSRKKNTSLSPVMARGLCLDNIHPALQVIFLGLFLEGNGRDSLAAPVLSHEGEIQHGPSARALSLPRS